MKKSTFLLLLLLALASNGFSQYWQQKVDYVIDVTLNDREKALDAFEKLTYTNNSPDTLFFIWFHLWPNAYKNDRTAFSDQLLLNGNTKFYFSDREERGYINRIDFRVDGATAKTEDHPLYIDVVKLLLPRPLPPGRQTVITTPFHVKLPFNYSRGGYSGESFQVTQWYPKPAIYDHKGWHPMPYLDQGEFYSEFGSYDVRITLPSNYVVAATGEEQGTKQFPAPPFRDFTLNPAKPKSRDPKLKQPLFPPSSKEFKTLQYRQDQIHDFAWFADKRFAVDHDTVQLLSGKIVNVYTYRVQGKENSAYTTAIDNSKNALRFYSEELGEYPYNVASVVEGPESFGGGMEYPTITVISPMDSRQELDVTIAHELGHNWFYGILASNEREHPWMDEGMNSFYENRYTEKYYGPGTKLYTLLYQTKANYQTDQPIETPSEKFTENNYGLIAYYKTADWMKLLQAKLGNEKFRSVMQAYYNEWKFRHPYPEDFKAVVNKYAGMETESLFALLDRKGKLPDTASAKFSLVTLFHKRFVSSYLQNPTQKALLLLPAFGYNSYDGVMLGALASNYKIVPNRFQFLVAPLYAVKSGQLTGIAKLNYTLMGNGALRRTDVFVNAARFSMNEITDPQASTSQLQVNKLVPGLRFTLREKDPLSTVKRYVQWKTFLFRESTLRVKYDSVITGTDTVIRSVFQFPTVDRYINQLKLVYSNHRALYPFSMELQADQGKDFIRPTFTWNHFFNYHEGGLSFRLFAGKFIYLGDQTLTKRFRNDRYHLNMSGPNGYEDYTYSNYFIGRNRFEGFESQQQMIRDGAFKVRTEMLANKVGKTDDWLAAINLNTSIPDKINPLSVLPVKIPLHLFADIGTNAEGWKRNSETDRFLFDAGFHIPLFKKAVNIYIPVIYSSVFSDYYKSTITKNRFFKTISFTIDLNTSLFPVIHQELDF